MAKYNVVLDSSIYRNNPKRDDLAFKALERLCNAGVLGLHLPYVVAREFQTQQNANYKKHLDAATSAMNSILRLGVSPGLAKNVSTILESLTVNTQPVLEDVEASIIKWADSLKAEHHPITQEEAISAMEAYFKGDAPLKAVKNREDIPDAFIFQNIKSIAQAKVPLFAIVEDGKLSSACEKVKNTTVYKTLQLLIESDEIQAEMLELDVVDNLTLIAKMLQDYEADSGEVSREISASAGGKILWTTIHSTDIPDDNNEAVITGCYDPDDIDINFESLNYFGSGAFGLPFSFRARVETLYYIFKADYYHLERTPSISDHNEHYFQAEEEFEVVVLGQLGIYIEPAFLKSVDAETLDENLTVTIDSISEIEVIG